MRIISGERRGAQLKAPAGLTTRPTLDRVRESLFSILHGIRADSRVLDLYAGSGALGLEALSRGAQHGVFVEQDRDACKVLTQNIQQLRYELRATAVFGSVWSASAQDQIQRQGPHDIILADPPYNHGRDEELIELCLPWLERENGCLVLQGGLQLREKLTGGDAGERKWQLDDHRRYGKTELLLISHKAGPDSD